MGLWRILDSSFLRRSSGPARSDGSYVYVPFGPFIMNRVQQQLSTYQGGSVRISTTAEKAGLGPKTSGAKQRGIKAGRLKGQLFACKWP